MLCVSINIRDCAEIAVTRCVLGLERLDFTDLLTVESALKQQAFALHALVGFLSHFALFNIHL